MFRQLLKSVAAAFDRIDIPYMIIGGQAVLIHGEARLTQDIDVTLAAGPDRLSDVVEAVRSAGWVVLVDDAEEFVRETLVLPCKDQNSDIRMDCVFSFTPYEASAISRAIELDVDGAQVRYATAEDLVIHKIFAGRPRDLEDVRGIMLHNPSLDNDYILTWLGRFDESAGESFTRIFEDVRKSIDRATDGPDL